VQHQPIPIPLIMGGPIVPPQRDDAGLNLIRRPMITRQHPIRLPLTKRPPMRGASPTTNRWHPVTSRTIMIARRHTTHLNGTTYRRRSSIDTSHLGIGRPNMISRHHAISPGRTAW